MNYHIYYFSATGNTERAAGIIAQELTNHGHAVQTIRVNRDSKPLADIPDRLLIAFPTLSWAPPILVQRFVRRLPPGKREDGSRTRAAVFTADGGGCLQAPEQMRRMLERRGYDVFLSGRGSYPDNWLQFVPGPGEERKQKMIAAGEGMTREYARQLLEEKPFHFTVAVVHRIWSRLVGALFAVFGRRFMGKMFIADSSCTSCRLCQKSCPVGAILMADRKRARPFWNAGCESCNRCINICPEKAIVSSYARITALIVACGVVAALGRGICNVWLKPALVQAVSHPGGGILSALLVIGVSLAAFFLVIGPFDRFFLRFVQRIPGLNRGFEKGFNKKFRRYTMPGYKPPAENLK
jgi:ferredoxin